MALALTTWMAIAQHAQSIYKLALSEGQMEIASAAREIKGTLIDTEILPSGKEVG